METNETDSLFHKLILTLVLISSRELAGKDGIFIKTKGVSVTSTYGKNNLFATCSSK